jgi:AraC-like DNA-binding protein
MGIQIEHQVFDDADEHAEALRHWNQRYQQIGAGQLRSSLTQLTADNLSIFREEFSQRITQQGCSPSSSVVTFGTVINVSSSRPAWFQGQPFGVHDFLCLPNHAEFTLHLPPNAKIIGITLKQSEWEILIHDEIHSAARQMMRRQRISVSPRDHVFLCRLIDHILNRQIADISVMQPGPVHPGDLERIPIFLASMVASGNVGARNNLTHMVHADIVERSRRIAMRPSEAPVTITDLCKELKISPRTLENSFVAVTGTSPASYLRSVRLAEVRRKLLNCTGQNFVSIGDAAAQWGFSTIHFAATYQKQYGELPSVTRRKKRA